MCEYFLFILIYCFSIFQPAYGATNSFSSVMYSEHLVKFEHKNQHNSARCKFNFIYILNKQEII